MTNTFESKIDETRKKRDELSIKIMEAMVNLNNLHYMFRIACKEEMDASREYIEHLYCRGEKTT